MKATSPASRSSRSPQGFTLVITLLMMILLTVAAVGLLGLSAISLRGGSQVQAKAEAQANARLALMLAIGELQKQLGPDQRVSANGAITAEATVQHPQWTGVWDSWKAGPGEASQHSTIKGVSDEMAPTYEPSRSGYFRAWLLSLSPGEASEIHTVKDLALTGSKVPTANATAVQLVGAGSLGQAANAADFVSARLLTVNSSASGSPTGGRYGWWVGDESQKARLMGDSYVTNGDDTLGARLSRQQAPGSMGTRAIKGMENVTDERQLTSLPTLMSAALVDGATKDAAFNFHSTTSFSYQVLADVREGGLKRDLSTLLERPISLSENGDEFMLYKFNDDERVPIQDLAAYYQLYKPSSGDAAGNAGVRYSSDMITSGIQIESPAFGDKDDPQKLYRQYSALYRSPVPIKFQFLLGLQSSPRSPTEIDATYPDTHELVMTITVAISLWNPTNLPIVMDNRESLRLFQRMRWWYLPLSIEWAKPGAGWTHVVPLKNMFSGGGDFAFELDISRGTPLRFEPGEVKVLSVPYNPTNNVSFERFDFDNNQYKRLVEGWDPEGVNRLSRSSAPNPKHQAPHLRNSRVLFSQGDTLQLTVSPDDSTREPMLIQLGQDSYHDSGISFERSHYNYTLSSRGGADKDFNKRLMLLGFEGNAPITANVPVSTLTAPDPENWSFLSFSIMAGCETHENSNSGFSVAGRKFASRPFLHSSAIRQGRIDSDDARSLYNSGWNWWIESISSFLEAPVEVTSDGLNGFYGGGYGSGSGTTHVVQQEIPLIPPMALAALSHAHLGGYSLADSTPPQPWSPTLEPTPLATGRGGMFPHTIQAVGNSYAHPYLEKDSAFDTGFQRTFTAADGPATVAFADHSYLANKALWDEFFFSSITPQPAAVEAFGGEERSARQIANAFFFDGKPLPNRRFSPLTRNFDEAKLNELFNEADDFGNGYEGKFGLADKIAAQLMVEGPFNINSTSVDAWRALLSSLKAKPVAYLDKDKALAGVTKPDVASTTDTPVSAFTMPNAKPGPGSSNPSDPGQWLGSRELDDPEINELANAIVRQVKLRGPFLSLSEFINRRLDSDSPELSAKGALQAALDDPSVSINAGFRGGVREFSDAEKSTMAPVFPEALDGPVAYGSAAYVDQADLLRNFAAQLTPRGDTFVIRTYGDATDSAGKVVARAWCEAVVQRMPDYFDPSDEPHVKQADLKSDANKAFGRRIELVSFRWLNPDEV